MDRRIGAEGGRRIRILVKQGVDPVEEERRRQREANFLGFDTYADHFVEHYLKEIWPKSWRVAQLILEYAKPRFRNRPITAIKRIDVAELLDEYTDRRG